MGHRHTTAGACRESDLRAFVGGFTAPARENHFRPAESTPALNSLSRFAASFLLFAVRGYQALLSPFLGGACRFHPSCSHYAGEAVARHGALRGAGLAFQRLLRCRPFSSGGYDPVPDMPEHSA